MADDPNRPSRHLGAVRRKNEERVTPLELFFDLVFVLALTQCVALMADEHSWLGLARGVMVFAVLWWAWVGYAWLTSVVDAEEGATRLGIFVAMAGMLVAALCVPQAFGDLALTFALAYGVVRLAHIFLFVLASDQEGDLRRSVTGLSVSTLLGVALLTGASFLDGWAQGALWLVAITLDVGGPFLFGSSGWKLVPGHFAERHGLVVIIALGESILAIGVGAAFGVTSGVVVAAVLGIFLAAAMWWTYFDVLAPAASARLQAATAGRPQNEMARDAYSYMHFLLVVGIAGTALGMKSVLAHIDEPLDMVSATAFLGGTAIYLAGSVAFKMRVLGRPSMPRLAAALVLVLLLPLTPHVDSLVVLGGATVVFWLLIAFETRRYAATREDVRHGSGSAGEAGHDQG